MMLILQIILVLILVFIFLWMMGIPQALAGLWVIYCFKKEYGVDPNEYIKDCWIRHIRDFEENLKD